MNFFSEPGKPLILGVGLAGVAVVAMQKKWVVLGKYHAEVVASYEKRYEEACGRYKEWVDSQRRRIEALELADKQHYGGGPNLPDGYRECGYCSTPTSGGGLCMLCLNHLDDLIHKADALVREP